MSRDALDKMLWLYSCVGEIAGRQTDRHFLWDLRARTSAQQRRKYSRNQSSSRIFIILNIKGDLREIEEKDLRKDVTSLPSSFVVHDEECDRKELSLE